MLATYPVVADRLASGVLVRPLGDEYTLSSSFAYDLLLPASGIAPRRSSGLLTGWWLKHRASGSR